MHRCKLAIKKTCVKRKNGIACLDKTLLTGNYCMILHQSGFKTKCACNLQNTPHKYLKFHPNLVVTITCMFSFKFEPSFSPLILQCENPLKRTRKTTPFTSSI